MLCNDCRACLRHPLATIWCMPCSDVPSETLVYQAALLATPRQAHAMMHCTNVSVCALLLVLQTVLLGMATTFRMYQHYHMNGVEVHCCCYCRRPNHVLSSCWNSPQHRHGHHCCCCCSHCSHCLATCCCCPCCCCCCCLRLGLYEASSIDCQPTTVHPKLQAQA